MYTGLRISDAARLDTSKVRGGRVFLHPEDGRAGLGPEIPDFVSKALGKRAFNVDRTPAAAVLPGGLGAGLEVTAEQREHRGLRNEFRTNHT
jgi:hypothetical protein